MRRTCMFALAMYSCLAGRTAPAQMTAYSDDEVKAQFVEAAGLSLSQKCACISS